MKIELIKDHTVNGRLLLAGTTLDLDDQTEKAWIKRGWAKSTRKQPDITEPKPVLSPATKS
ncbi:MAG: hypothetical protein AB1705_22640 [Verrucomicrobiota bacterium]